MCVCVKNTRDSQASERPGEVVQSEKSWLHDEEPKVVSAENCNIVNEKNNECQESYTKCQSEASDLKAKLDKCNVTVSDLKKQTARCKTLREQAFFRQYVSVLLDQFKNFKEQVCYVYCF